MSSSSLLSLPKKAQESSHSATGESRKDQQIKISRIISKRNLTILSIQSVNSSCSIRVKSHEGGRWMCAVRIIYFSLYPHEARQPVKSFTSWRQFHIQFLSHYDSTRSIHLQPAAALLTISSTSSSSFRPLPYITLLPLRCLSLAQAS